LNLKLNPLKAKFNVLSNQKQWKNPAKVSIPNPAKVIREHILQDKISPKIDGLNPKPVY